MINYGKEKPTKHFPTFELISIFKNYENNFNLIISNFELILGEEVDDPNDDDNDEYNENFDLNEDELDELDEAPKYMKYASRKDRFQHCKQAGLTSLVNKFGLTCEQFGENLNADYQMHEVEQCASDPHELAAAFVNETQFQNTEQVLAAAKYMMTIMLARDPLVRTNVRELFMQHACVDVRPTVPRGLKDVDENHPCYTNKYLKEKPCSELSEDEFLKLTQAEQDGLLTITFRTKLIKKFVSEPVARFACLIYLEYDRF